MPLLVPGTSKGWPGITKEVQDICRDIGLPDATLKYISRKEIKEAMCYHHLGILKKEMLGKSKFDETSNTDTRKIQAFILGKSLENARLEVLWLTNMLDTRTMMKGKYKEPYTCPHCTEGRNFEALESPLHLLQCKAYLELRNGINPESLQKERSGDLRKVI